MSIWTKFEAIEILSGVKLCDSNSFFSALTKSSCAKQFRASENISLDFSKVFFNLIK